MSKNTVFEQDSIEGGISKTTPAFRKGDCKDVKTTIVLSAPGQREEEANRPAAGQTGTTLQTAINFWHKECPSKFPSSKLDDYSIINAVADVHYMSKTGRTEGSVSEVCDLENLKRISEVLKDSETVVALGKMAKLAVDSASFSGVILEGSHPSMQSLNKKYDSQKNSPSDRSRERIGMWAKDLLGKRTDCKK